MQKRHRDNDLYFSELASTCRQYYIPYLQKVIKVENISVLEIGCGHGGNLLPFYERGCYVVGIDIDKSKIETAIFLFAREKIEPALFEFRIEDFYSTIDTRKYDLILVHDVIEHIRDKEVFMGKAKQMLADNGIIFYRFPAWNMPFGGHQQLCSNKLSSMLPFTHLLPVSIYTKYLNIFKEKNTTISELLEIKQCKVTIVLFQKLVFKTGLKIIDRSLWFINPHYKIKFGLPPLKLNRRIASIKYLRNYFTTSCFYLLKKNTDPY
jgi:2-polyprenyl-3-methyl-5-hydroxy-6-metoxy-1,4-benzoquinol methylase